MRIKLYETRYEGRLNTLYHLLKKELDAFENEIGYKLAVLSIEADTVSSKGPKTVWLDPLTVTTITHQLERRLNAYVRGYLTAAHWVDEVFTERMFQVP